jgi:hypothetical protein
MKATDWRDIWEAEGQYSDWGTGTKQKRKRKVKGGSWLWVEVVSLTHRVH